MSLATQQQDARNATYMLAPGESLPTGETLPSKTAGSSRTSPTLPPSMIRSDESTASATAVPTPSKAATSGRSISAGAIAGIVVGGLAAVAVIGALLFYLGRHRTELEFLRRDIHIQSQRPAPSEPKAHYTDCAPTSPTLRYDPNDPGIGEHQVYDVPPYPTNSAAPVPGTAEMESSELVRSRPHSPWSDGSDTQRGTASPPPRGFMERLKPDIEQHELAGSRESTMYR